MNIVQNTATPSTSSRGYTGEKTGYQSVVHFLQELLTLKFPQDSAEHNMRLELAKAIIRDWRAYAASSYLTILQSQKKTYITFL